MSGGNPLFTKKFVQALIFMNLLRLEDVGEPVNAANNMASPFSTARASKERKLSGQCAWLRCVVCAYGRYGSERCYVMGVAVTITPSMFLPVPYKIQRIIATDLNRLSVDATVALKCASVLCVGGGQTYVEFDIGMLAVIYPHDGGKAMTSKDLEPHLDTLVQVRMSRWCGSSRGRNVWSLLIPRTLGIVFLQFAMVRTGAHGSKPSSR